MGTATVDLLPLVDDLLAVRPDLHAHSMRVSHLCLEVGERLGLGTQHLLNLGEAAQLHDVGKLAVPHEILDKPDAPTAAEWAVLRRHADIGAGMVSDVPEVAHLAAAVRGVHERWDGGGYPDGLAGEQIAFAARIIAVCDAFDAMCHRDLYRVPLRYWEGVRELRRCCGTQFDPQVVRAFTARHLCRTRRGLDLPASWETVGGRPRRPPGSRG